jgi:IS5 family transposase
VELKSNRPVPQTRRVRPFHRGHILCRVEVKGCGDARWTKKSDHSFYGYKNHISVDRKHKLIRRYTETDALVHDSQTLDEVLDKTNTSNEVWADSAYRSVETEAKLEAKGYKSRIHRRGVRNNPLCKRQQAANTTRSRVRARVEHLRIKRTAWAASSCAPSAWCVPERRSVDEPGLKHAPPCPARADGGCVGVG